MDRRSSLKALALGSISGSLLLDACKQETAETPVSTSPSPAENSWDASSGRQPFEVKRDMKLLDEKYFTDHEMLNIGVLADIIIPRDDHSGSAGDAGVPAFIEFIVKDMPELKIPMRGGLSWLDYTSMNLYGNGFAECTRAQQIALVDQIAWPSRAKPEMTQGVHFFSLMRNLTATGFFSSKMGIADIGYMGNTPNIWDGVPPDVLSQYHVSYDAKTLERCVRAEDHDKMFHFS